MTPAKTKTAIDIVAVPIGGIIMWSGAVADIPAGWHLCDGTEGTPDLRNRFVIGAGSSYSPNATGGSSSISGVPSHSHNISQIYLYTDSPYKETDSLYNGWTRITGWTDGRTLNLWDATFIMMGDDYANRTTATYKSKRSPFAGTTDYSGSYGISTMPPYYALCYIMLIGQ